MTKNDSLGSLKEAQKFLHQEQQRFKNRQQAIEKFDSLPLNEKRILYRKYKGNNHHVCFATDYDKLKIIGYL